MIEGSGHNNINYSKLSSFYRIFNTIKIDVVIGVIFSTILASELMNINLSWAYWITLPLSVWIVYTLDHMIDAFRLKEKASTFRHKFHYRYFKTFLFFISILSLANLTIILFWIEKEIISFGMILLVACFIYFLLLHLLGRKKSILFKEIFVSAIYMLGVWGGVIVLNNFELTFSLIILIIIFLLLVFVDVLLLSFYDLKSDTYDGHQTITVRYGRKATTRLIITILMIIFILCIYIIVTNDLFLYRVVAKLFLIMGLIEAILIGFPEYFKKNNLYQYIIELVFWIPGLIILINY